MKSDDRATAEMADADARRAAVARLVDALHRRPMGTHAGTVLPEDLEGTVRQVERDADLTACFREAATALGMHVHSATAADWIDVVVALLREHAVKAAFLPHAGDGFFQEEQAASLCKALVNQGIGAKAKAVDETLFSVDAAITGAGAAIAETGTLVCESRATVARSASLIPPVHIAVVGVDQLLPDLYDYFQRSGDRGELPANINLISGPSKTADIEGMLVTGVHGPREVHVVLVRAN
jgi:L-lactate dehydrogenase complex protein LldG